MMIASRKVSAVVGRRAFSSVEQPRLTIAKNILIIHELAAAKSTAELEAAINSSPKIDLELLRPELAGLKGYLSEAKFSTGAGAAFTADKTAWQNLPFADYVAAEAGRADTWPFLVGGITTFLLLGFLLPLSLPEEGKKKSKYISMIEGRHGVIESDHGHAAHH